MDLFMKRRKSRSETTSSDQSVPAASESGGGWGRRRKASSRGSSSLGHKGSSLGHKSSHRSRQPKWLMVPGAGGRAGKRLGLSAEGLMDLVVTHQTEEVSRVVETELDVSAIDPQGELLLAATRLGFTDIVAILIRNNINIYETGSGHLNALHLAARLGYLGMVSLLLSHGARVNEASKYEWRTALHVAAMAGRQEVLDLLLENDAKVDQTDIYGQTALHLCARQGSYHCCEAVLAAGATVDRINHDGWTPLHVAAEAGHVECCKILIAHRANPSAQTKFGRTPLHWAARRGHLRVAIFLTEAGATVNVKDAHGRTAVDDATCPQLKQYLVSLARSRDSFRVFTEVRHLNLNLKPTSQSTSGISTPTSGNNLYDMQLSPSAVTLETTTTLDEEPPKEDEEVFKPSVESSPRSISKFGPLRNRSNTVESDGTCARSSDDNSSGIDVGNGSLKSGSSVRSDSFSKTDNHAKKTSLLERSEDILIDSELNSSNNNNCKPTKGQHNKRYMTKDTTFNGDITEGNTENADTAEKLSSTPNSKVQLQLHLFRLINGVNKRLSDLELSVSKLEGSAQSSLCNSHTSLPGSECDDVRSVCSDVTSHVSPRRSTMDGDVSQQLEPLRDWVTKRRMYQRQGDGKTPKPIGSPCLSLKSGLLAETRSLCSASRVGASRQDLEQVRHGINDLKVQFRKDSENIASMLNNLKMS